MTLVVEENNAKGRHKQGVVSLVIDYNPGQNIWNKIEKSSKTGQGRKSLIYTFPWFLTATDKV